MRATLFVVGLAVLGVPVLARDPSQTNAAWRDPSPHHVRWITVDSSIHPQFLDDASFRHQCRLARCCEFRKIGRDMQVGLLSVRAEQLQQEAWWVVEAKSVEILLAGMEDEPEMLH